MYSAYCKEVPIIYNFIRIINLCVLKHILEVVIKTVNYLYCLLCVLFPLSKYNYLYSTIAGVILPLRCDVYSTPAGKPPLPLFVPGCWLCLGNVHSSLHLSLGASPAP